MLKGLAAAELILVVALLLVAWLLKAQWEELVELQLEVDRLKLADPWRGRLPS